MPSVFKNADRGAQGKEADLTRSDHQKPDDEGPYQYTDGVHAQAIAVKVGGEILDIFDLNRPDRHRYPLGELEF